MDLSNSCPSCYVSLGKHHAEGCGFERAHIVLQDPLYVPNVTRIDDSDPSLSAGEYNGHISASGGYVIKDSGTREEFSSGMVRDSGDKPRYLRIFTGPMAKRWAEHLHKGSKKYPDIKPGIPNWTLASGEAELQRFKESALDHMIKWLDGWTDEDHASAVFFNINGAEYVKSTIQPPVPDGNPL